MTELIADEGRYPNFNLTDNFTQPNINLAGVMVPSVPFLWYREQEIYCPIEMIHKVSSLQLKQLLVALDYDNPNIIDTWNLAKYYLVIQRNVLADKNVYICYHAYVHMLLHYKLGTKLLQIPPRYANNTQFKTYSVPIKIGGETGLKLTGSLKENQWIQGSVHTHDRAFSPPGQFEFKVDKDYDVSVLLTMGMSDGLVGSPHGCLFVLVNDFEADNKNVKDVLQDLFGRMEDGVLKQHIIQGSG